MSLKPAIRVENLSKCYNLGASAGEHWRLSDALKSAARSTVAKVKALGSTRPAASENAYWAVKDVSFQVERGEVLGLVGRNGAGKSTLLKLLSRITVPTSGRIEVRGRLGSLLEVGTGFHPELTGRENVYLNGSILGMTRREITKKFGQIVEFSEIGKFLDTPVKRYSSGMYVRLAFSIAAHLEPDVLILDEVLAVGDATFQRKCIDRMTDLARQGRTILFVTHNMQLVPRLCDRAVHLAKGQVLEIGPSDEVTQHYLDRILEDSRGGDLRQKPRSGDGRARFVRAEAFDAHNEPVSAHLSGDDLTIRMEIEAAEALPSVAVRVALQTLHGTRVVTGWTREAGLDLALTPGTQSLSVTFAGVGIRPGQTFLVNLQLSNDSATVIDDVESAIVLDVVGDERTANLSTNTDQGLWAAPQKWTKG
jgi:lipopolysaccharide transport system ATP-binding protein